MKNLIVRPQSAEQYRARQSDYITHHAMSVAGLVFTAMGQATTAEECVPLQLLDPLDYSHTGRLILDLNGVLDCTNRVMLNHVYGLTGARLCESGFAERFLKELDDVFSQIVTIPVGEQSLFAEVLQSRPNEELLEPSNFRALFIPSMDAARSVGFL